SGAVRQGQLNAQGETQVNGLADGPVDITFGQPIEDPAIQAQRQQVKQALEHILQAEKEEAARIESAHQQRNLLGKAMAYQSALAKGTGEALWGLLTGFKELTDLGTQHLNNALGAAWETWRHADEERYLQTFLENFQEAEFQELIDVLGIDPRSITREQWAEAQSLLNFLWHDDETQAQLIDFAKDYIDAQHGLEIAETGAGMVTEVAVDILITALTLGMGAALAVTSSLGKALKQLAQKLKQKASSTKAQSQTGTWHYDDLEKPGHKFIELRDGANRGEYDGVVGEVAPDSGRLGQSGGSAGWGDEADEAYDVIQKRNDDIMLISQNTGFKESNIQKIKNHLFYDTHKKYDAYGDDFVEWGRLDSDKRIADSWNRLIEGTYGGDDIKLLKHEAAERKILDIWGPGTGKAHQRAHSKYPSPIQD
ncbi:MAG: hypothetical protein P8098_17910, partial [Candidatus Thiodiazotropha sp.]